MAAPRHQSPRRRGSTGSALGRGSVPEVELGSGMGRVQGKAGRDQGGGIGFVTGYNKRGIGGLNRRYMHVKRSGGRAIRRMYVSGYKVVAGMVDRRHRSVKSGIQRIVTFFDEQHKACFFKYLLNMAPVSDLMDPNQPRGAVDLPRGTGDHSNHPPGPGANPSARPFQPPTLSR